MKIYQTRNIKDYKPILEGLVDDFGYVYYHAILSWCDIITISKDNKPWEVWVIEVDNKIVGICGLFSHNMLVEELWLGWFGIVPEYRNKGLGSDVLKWMEETARNMGCKKIYSYVDRNGKPLPFYFRNGYSRICSVREYLDTHEKADKNDFEDDRDHVIVKEL